MPELGINLMVWSGSVDQAVRELFPKIAAMGYSGVEVPIFDPDGLDVDATASALAASGLRCTASTALPRGLSLIDPALQAPTVDWLRRLLETVARLGADILCGPMLVPVGELRGRGYLPAEWQTCVQGLKAVSKHAEACGVALALEPLNRFETFMINTVTDGIRLVQEVDSSAVGLLLDTFHMHIEEKSTSSAIRRAAPHIRHFHCSENDRGPAGSGQVAWASVFAALTDIGYDGWLVVESFNAVITELARTTCIWRPVAESPEALARDSLAFLRAATDWGPRPPRP